jgi:hypothetical protein
MCQKPVSEFVGAATVPTIRKQVKEQQERVLVRLPTLYYH